MRKVSIKRLKTKKSNLHKDAWSQLQGKTLDDIFEDDELLTSLLVAICLRLNFMNKDLVLSDKEHRPNE